MNFTFELLCLIQRNFLAHLLYNSIRVGWLAQTTLKKKINNSDFSSNLSLRSDVLQKNSSTVGELTLSNTLLMRPRLFGYPLQMNVFFLIYPLPGGSGFCQLTFTNLNSQLFHDIVQHSYSSIRYQISGITGSFSAWTGTNTGTVTFQNTGLDCHMSSAMRCHPLSRFSLRC